MKTVNRPTSIRFACLGLFLAVLLGLFFAIIQINGLYEKNNAYLNTRLDNLIYLSNEPIKHALATRNNAQIERIANGLLHDELVSSIKIYSKKNKLVFSKAKKAEVKIPWWLPKVFLSENQFAVNYFNRDAPSKNAARIEFTLDTSRQSIQFIDEVREIILNELIRNMLLAVGLSLIFHYFLSKPLATQLQVLQEINPRHPSKARLPIPRKHEASELGVLAFSINSLLRSIEIHIQTVEHINATLEEKVHLRTQDLEIKTQEALESLEKLEQTQETLIEAEKNAALTTLVAGVAHEVNTPLGVTITASTHLSSETEKMIKMFEANKVTTKSFASYLQLAKETAGIIHKNIGNAAEIVQSFKQVSVQQSAETPRLLNLKYYLDHIILMLSPQLKEMKISVHIDCASTIELYTMPGVLMQVISNLVMNSLVHAFEDGEAGHIGIQVTAEGEEIIFVYKDDGKGISEENMAHIFEPFFTTKRQVGGTGLGMHVVYNIVTTALSGSIKVDSTENQGVTFTIVLPHIRDEYEWNSVQ